VEFRRHALFFTDESSYVNGEKLVVDGSVMHTG
jgi:hypothetical protein